jgi:hypothetical protein
MFCFVCVNVMKRNSFLLYLRCPEEETQGNFVKKNPKQENFLIRGCLSFSHTIHTFVKRLRLRGDKCTSPPPLLARFC